MRRFLFTAPALAALCALTFSAAPLHAQTPYQIQHTWKLGGDGGWDYLAVDPASKLLYITRGTHVMVVDTAQGKQVADIPGLHGIHCVVFSTDGVHGYITDGGANQVAVFDRRTNTIQKTIPVGDHPDGAVFEPVTKTVWAFNGRSHNVSVIDTNTDTVVATIELPGKPEFPVADGRGNVYDNIEDKSQIVRLDAAAHTVTAAWSILPCEGPSGLAIDPAHRRLFAVCDAKMAVVDADSGKVIATPDTGDGPDASRFSKADQVAFSPNGGSGTLTIVHEDTPDKFTVVQTLATLRGARTMAMDPDGSRVYLVTAEFGPRPTAATPDNPRMRPPMLPGSFTVLAIGH
ncbi:MAG TPA: YncE family protein [Acidobacteriaceae bacterium]|jgi:YVTN family beta-propeller protein|nr:YncE family protein [Acidobacteriaceae bacterium]